MAFATINKGSSYFNTVLYTGNDSTQTITGVGFQPDLWWNKSRSGTHNAGVHCWYDSVRGTTKRLKSNSTDAEAIISGVTAFNADGVTLGSENQSNGGSTEYVAWNWKANGAGVSNTSGTITSTVSANTTSGFSIVSFTTTSGGNATIGHGLGSVPKMIIMKARDQTYNWDIYHVEIGNANRLVFTTASSAGTSCWGSTTPTSSVFTMDQSFYGSGVSTIAYCFAEVKGYSKFGSYTGNGNANGTFVYTGFKPAYVMVKVTSTTSDWLIADIKRLPINVMNGSLAANLTNQESYFNGNDIDFLSNGFKLRTTNGVYNSSGASYIYMAFAENPFVLTDGTPVTAR